MLGQRKPRRPAASALATIDVVDYEPDVEKRASLLLSALVRVARVSRLIEVREADYDRGHLEALVEEPNRRPRTSTRVCVRYDPAPEA